MRPPNGTFKGKNIMTPTRLGYYRLPDDRWAELSKGEGIDGEPIFGVTVRLSGGGRCEGSRLLYSMQAALAYITEISHASS